MDGVDVSDAIRSMEVTKIVSKVSSINENKKEDFGNKTIQTEEDNNKRISWLTLSKIVYDINMLLLDTLGIEVPNKI